MAQTKSKAKKSAKPAAGSAPVDTSGKTSPSPSPAPSSPLPDPGQFGFRGQIFLKLDLDHSGYLVEAEIPAARREALMTRDQNADSRIDVAEFDAALPDLPVSERGQATAPSRQVLLTPPPAGQSVPIYVPRRAARAGAPEWFLARDQDQDGQLGLNEWPRSALAEFDRLDTNHDGFVTLAEALAPAPVAPAVPAAPVVPP